MLTISGQAMDALERAAQASFIERLAGWLAAHPRLAGARAPADPDSVRQAVALARSFGIEDEADVANFAMLRCLHGDQWLQGSAAQEILTSGRTGELKVWQLGYLSGG